MSAESAGDVLLELRSLAQRALGADAVAVIRRTAIGPHVTYSASADMQLDVGYLTITLAEIDAGLPEKGFADLAVASGASTSLRRLLSTGVDRILSAPIALNGRRLGSVHALRAGGGAWCHPELIEPFARQAALAIHADPPSGSGVVLRGGNHLAPLEALSLGCAGYEDLSERLTSIIRDSLGATISGVMLWDADRHVLQMVPGAFGVEGSITASYQVAESEPASNAARVFTTGMPYLSNDAESDPGILVDYTRAFHIKRLLTVRLATGSRLVGVLHVANKDADFDVADVQAAQTIAHEVARVVDTARTMFDLQRQLKLEAILSDFALKIASGDELHNSLDRTLELARATVGALWMALVPVHGDSIMTTDLDPRNEIHSTALTEARQQPGLRATVVVPRGAGDAGHAIFHAPVVLGSQRIGTVSAVRARGEPFDQYERRALVRLADLIALGWATDRYQRERAVVARLHERQRIADDLHDRVAQLLFAALIGLDSLIEASDLPETDVTKLKSVRALLVRGDAAIRTVIYDLARPASNGLVDRLVGCVEEVEREYGLAIRLEISDEAERLATSLRAPEREAFIRVAQEALVNAAKHAGPCRACVELTRGSRGRLQLAVTDDGLGPPIDGIRPGYGLTLLRRMMRQQGGTIRVERRASGGLRMVASIQPRGHERKT